MKYLTDGESYRARDWGNSGCEEATNYLEELWGPEHPSRCQECPYKACKLDTPKKPGRKKGVKYRVK